MSADIAALPALAVAAVVAALLARALLQARAARRQLAELDAAVERAQAAGRELAARVAKLESLKDAQQNAEQALHLGGSLVREVHKGIAAIPFDILEAIPATRLPSKAVREVHDRITDGVYDALGGLNKAVGRELRRGLRIIEGEGLGGDPAPASAEKPASLSPPEPTRDGDKPPR